MNDTADHNFETIPDPAIEAAQIQEIADITVKLLKKRYASPKQILRAVHPKSHGCVKATFEVLGELDEPLKVGLFANPGKYEARIRFSNATALVGADILNGRHGSRGMAVKVFGVKGTNLLSDDGQSNQDFLMINQASFAFANIPDYLRLNKILLEKADVPDSFFDPIKEGGDKTGFTNEDLARIGTSAKAVTQIAMTPVRHPLEVQYFSAAPFLYGGNRVMKYSAKPVGGPFEKLGPNPAEHYLRDALEAAMKENKSYEYDFGVQVRNYGEEGLNIEDATAVWDEAKFPFVTVAKITIAAPQPDIASKAAVDECENLVFTPWHSLAEHKPIGGINRLRKLVYQASEGHRRAVSKA